MSDFTANLKYEDIPPEALQRAKYIAMQTIGAALSANGLPIADKAVGIGKACGAGEPSATLWIDGGKVSMTSAAFCNSTLADALDWEDCSWTGHPSAGVIPVAWAVAEGLHKSGKDLLVSIVVAYEVYQRIAMVVQPPASWDILQGRGLTSWQVFAGVVPSAKLMGLNSEQINQALGFGVLCCPVQSNLHHATMSDAYHFEHGFRAKDGILSAMTAKAGIANYTDCPLGHPKNMMTPEQFCDRFRVQAAPTLDKGKIEKAVAELNDIENCEDIASLGWIFSPTRGSSVPRDPTFSKSP